MADLECGKCRCIKPEEAFATSGTRPTGRQLWCRSCASAYAKERYRKRSQRTQVASCKTCVSCGCFLPASEFTRWALSDDLLRDKCKQCVSVEKRGDKYGLCEEEVLHYLRVPQCQNPHCGKVFASDSEVQFDHCHLTGAVRGVLCSKCNTAAGHGGEAELRRIRGLVMYLERHSEQG